MSRRRVSSDHPGMKNIPGEVSIFCLWTNWIHLKEYIFKLWQDRIPWAILFALSIAVHTGGLAKNRFWLVATEKKRIGEQPNYFWNMCPKSFAWAKNKRKLVLTESQEDRFYRERHLCVLTSAILYLYVKRTMLFDVRSVNNWLILQRNFYTSIAFGLTEHHELNNSSYLFAILILLWGLRHINSSNSWCGLAVRYIMPNPRLFWKLVIVYCR